LVFLSGLYIQNALKWGAWARWAGKSFESTFAKATADLRFLVLSFELKMRGIGKLGKGQVRRFFRNCERKSIKSADFRTKRAGVLKWVFENIQKHSKIFKNIRKLSRNIQKYSKIFEFLRPPCANCAK